jgi:hypothetical protein
MMLLKPGHLLKNHPLKSLKWDSEKFYPKTTKNSMMLLKPGHLLKNHPLKSLKWDSEKFYPKTTKNSMMLLKPGHLLKNLPLKLEKWDLLKEILLNLPMIKTPYKIDLTKNTDSTWECIKNLKKEKLLTKMN